MVPLEGMWRIEMWRIEYEDTMIYWETVLDVQNIYNKGIIIKAFHQIRMVSN
jgi:hypothetical protein